MLLQKMGYVLEKPKQIDFVDMTDRFVNAQTEYILNFTNNIIKITNGEKIYYFRESKPHCKTAEQCVLSAVKAFFEEVVADTALRDKVADKLKKSANMRKIVNMGSKDKNGSNFNKYLVSGDESFLGFFTAKTESDKKNLRALAFYIYGELYAHWWNVRIKPGQLQTFSAIRTMGVAAIAKMLGIGETVCRSEFVKISINGRVKYGILSDNVEGSCRTDVEYKERLRRVTPQLLRSFTNLNVLDFISCDTDHRVGNYHVIEDENLEYVCVISYDNDSPPTFRHPLIRVKNPMNYSPLVRGKRINRVGMDKALATALRGLDRKKIETLSTYLGSIQVNGVWKRVKRLKNALNETIKGNGDFLLEREEWSIEHVKRDLSGRFGKTYLGSFVSDTYFKNGLHDFDTL